MVSGLCHGAPAELDGCRFPVATHAISGYAEELLRAGFAGEHGAYQLSVLWKGLRNRKGAGDWEGTGFI